ncbi:hypothetical protein [Microcoleus sp. PH2017_05_CCC_O_A]|uniref:hypothetical protein n=1 Tax=Microcoleus sp. PH2017_05_CCC_O_A TaxID=2798816 RepID=UPI001D79BAFE|nr:hypothetical protein [Microcoleus sp. PH2017_05_CCC_O_A]MCC3439223.1 hypothetical protein [Microcoleus sp. PH2017_05_CCC_O_A]
MPAERSHVWTIYSKARSHFLHNGTQKVDRTFRTMELKRSIALLAQWNSKGRSHLLHNLLKRSIADLGNLLKS